MQNERNILTSTIIYFIGCAISIATLILFTQITGLNIFNQSSIPGFIKYVSLPLIISIFIGYAITISTYQSQKKFVAISTFLVIIILLIALGIYYSYTCQELACIFVGYIALATFIILIPFSASIPVLFEEFPTPVSLIFVAIITIIVTGAVSFRAIINVNAQKTEAKKEQSIIKNSDMPLYDTNYDTFANKKIIFNMTHDNRNDNSLKPHQSVNGIDFSWLSYEGWWLDNQRGFRDIQDDELDIRELKPAKNFSDEELHSRDLAELKRYQQFEGPKYNVQLEEIKINNYPAVNILEQGNLDDELRIYRQGIIIQVKVFPAGKPMGSYPKEDLVKLAESLYPTYP